MVQSLSTSSSITAGPAQILRQYGDPVPCLHTYLLLGINHTGNYSTCPFFVFVSFLQTGLYGPIGQSRLLLLLIVDRPLFGCTMVPVIQRTICRLDVYCVSSSDVDSINLYMRRISDKHDKLWKHRLLDPLLDSQ